MKTFVVVLCLAMLPLSTSSPQKLYEWVDEKGVVHINDDSRDTYFSVFQKKVYSKLIYPKESQTAEQGETLLKIAINKNGSLGDIAVIRSSGYAHLDRAAISAVRSASPFNPIPSSWNLEKLELEIPFLFRIEENEGGKQRG